MNRFSYLILVIMIGTGAASILRSHQNHPLLNSNQAVAQDADGAFRDGLYLGRLAAESGAEPRIAVGRWATVEDRSSFTAGYQQGYSQALASRSGPSSQSLGAD